MQKRIWEIAEIFYCPIVGICLSIKEQRQYLKRCGVNARGAQDYAVHVTLIDMLKKESAPAKRFEKLLNRKYRKEITAWQYVTPEEWMPFFDRHLCPATAGALLWFLAIYLNLSERQQVEVYGALHMFMHAQFFKQAALLNQLAQKTDMYKQIKEKYHALQIQFRQERHSFQELERRHALQQKEIYALQAEVLKLKQAAPVETVQAECDLLRQKLQSSEEKLRTRTVAVENLKIEKSQIKQQLDEYQTVVEDMQGELVKILDQFTRATSQTEHCPNAALCNRRILIVGGITKLRAFYEQLVIKMGGQFEYHDGYKYNGAETLSHLVGRSDVVICPVNVNSHSACLHVKKCCKELNKPYYMLRSSSLSAIHSTLAEVARIGEGKALA